MLRIHAIIGPMTNLYILVIMVAGAGVGAQIAVNAGLGAATMAPLWAANINFAVSVIVGLTALGISMLLGQPVAPNPAMWTAPKWVWLGGVFGGTYVLLAIILTRSIGVAMLSAATIVGQLTASLLIDHYGWFGATVYRLSATRVIGAVFLMVGVALIRWKQ
jgi:transporter family-2 protein